MTLDDDSDLFDPPARPKQPSNKIIYQPPGAQWSLSRLPEVESLYRSSFNKQLPLVNKGQGSIHNKWGYDHRNSADVSINPSTPEGQQFTEQLKKANIPFLAFTGAIPGVATGPHVHIGFPSHRTQQKFNVGAQKKSTTVASDDLFDSPQSPQSQQPVQTDDDLFDLPEQSTPRTSAERVFTPPRATAAPTKYNTQLTPDEERDFQKWKAVFAPNDSGADYDLRGAYKAGLKPDPKTAHWPDRFKKPNHPTFSNESQYAVGENAAKAGHWEGNKFIPATPAITDALNQLTRGTNLATEKLKRQASRQPNKLFQQLGQQRTIDQSQREQEQQARDEVVKERASRVGAYGAPTPSGMLHLIANPVDSLTGLFRSEDENVNREVQERLKQQQIASEPEVTEIRKEYGQMPAAVRSVAAPVLGRGGGGLLKTAGGVASLFGIAPNRLSEWANKRGEIVEAGSSLTPLRKKQGLSSLITGNKELEEVERGIPEKLATGIADVGVGVAQVLLLKKATGLPFNQLLALEAAARNSDKPIDQQLGKAAEGYAMGSALESHLSRGANAALFGLPTAAQTGYEVSQGRMSPLDAAIQTGIQAGAGAVLTGRKESSLEHGLAREALYKSVKDSVTNLPVGTKLMHPNYIDGVPAVIVKSTPKSIIVSRHGETRELPLSLIRDAIQDGMVTVETGNIEITARLRGEQRGTQTEVQSPMETQRAEKVLNEPQAQVQPPEPNTVRYYRADRPEAEGPEGGGWSNNLDYVSGKYGKGAQGGESVWYVDVPKRALEAEYGDAQSASILRENPKDLGATEPKLYRRINESQIQTESPVEAQRTEVEPAPSAREVRVFHGGPKGQKFDFERLPLSTKGDSAQLGYFFSPERKGATYYAGTEGEVNEFTLQGRPYTMSEQEYKSLGSRADFSAKRRELVERGYDYVEIPYMGEVVALRPEAIKAEPSQKFFHRDYGEVVESPNQKQVGKNRVRVIDENGREHVIKRAAMTGAGNQRAVPIRSEPTAQPSVTPPAEVKTQPSATESQLSSTKEVADVTQEAALVPESLKLTSSLTPEGVRPSSTQWKVPPEPLSAKSVTEPVTETAVKNASMAADRAARDLPELVQAEPRKATEVHQRALDANARDPRSVDRLVQQALESDKNLTDVETAQIRLRAQEIKNREQELLREIDSTTEPQTIREKRVELDSLTNEFDRLSQATKKAGTEWGRAGVARQQAINEDYSLVAMRARMKAAKGRELSEKESIDVENLHRRINDLEAQVAEANQRAEAKIFAESVNKFIREHKLNVRKQARARTREGLQAERSDLKQQIAETWKKRNEGVQPSGLASLDPEGELTRLIGKLARNYIEDGVTRAGDLVDAVHSHISDVADLTKREVSDLISGYGVIRKPSADPVERKLNELKSILASQSGKADVVEQGIRPLRRGQQREKPTEDQRRALRELQDAMAQHPEISRGKPSEIEQQTPLDKAKTTTRNRIEQLKSWIESGKKEVQGRAKVIPDAELTQLKTERDALQKVANLLDDPQADQRAIERRVSELSQTISRGRSKLVSGKVEPDFKEGAKALWTEEIGRLERERVKVNKDIAKARAQKAREAREAKAATPEGQEERHQKDLENKLKGLNKSIGNLRAKIQSGATESQAKEGAQSVWSKEVSALEKERAILRQITADMRKQPKTPKPKASFYGATGSWAEYEAQARKTLAAQKAQAKRITNQIAEYERRATTNDFGPRSKRAPVTSTPELDAARESLARAKNQFLRKEREFKLASRGPGERAADLLIRWGRAAKLSYISTLGKLTGAATGRMIMSPIENLVGEIPHRLSPELSRRATIEGGGFDRVAEVAALWKSGRFKQMLNQITKGSSDLDVLYGGQKGIDKEMSSEGVLGIPGRVHGALKEYPRQAEFDRAFIKTLRNYERAGKDIADPQVQLAAKMEAYNSAERARFQQRNFISDEFNNAMGRWERRGGLAKGAAKVGRFVFPITRVPVNVAGETLNYTLGIPRAAIETAIRGGVSKLTPEQANNIMRAYKKGGVGLAIMAYAYFHPQQFGGYYQKNDRRSESEPAPGEVMFFGHRIPKWATHIPIIEAGQLAATVRRVSDKLREQGEDKSEATLGGVTAGAKGVAGGIPFYETPARFFTGQEGARGWAEVVGQQGKGLIPGFVQEGAQLMDKDAQGKPIKRSPSGSFGQRVGQTIEMGIPGLRSRVPLNDRAIKSDRKAELIEKFRRGEIDKSDLAIEDLTPAERSAISRIGKQTERQTRFSNFPAATALDRFERMDAAHQEEVREQMEKKAYTLTHSDTLTDQQKADFQERLDRLGITPREPKKSSGSFKDLFRPSASPF